MITTTDGAAIITPMTPNITPISSCAEIVKTGGKDECGQDHQKDLWPQTQGVIHHISSA